MYLVYNLIDNIYDTMQHEWYYVKASMSHFKILIFLWNNTKEKDADEIIIGINSTGGVHKETWKFENQRNSRKLMSTSFVVKFHVYIYIYVRPDVVYM